MLYATALIRSIHKYFDRVNIFVAHTHPDAEAVFRNNPLVSDIICAPDEQLDRLVVESSTLDIFDLISDIRYVVTHVAPPQSRIDPTFIAHADAKSRPWQKYVRAHWPQVNNRLAQAAIDAGMNQYQLTAHTANLADDEPERPEFFLSVDDELVAYKMMGTKPYVTIHHGADAKMAGRNGLQTKNMTTSQWSAVVAILASKHVAVAQLGSSSEPLVPGVTFDLRGQTGFGETAAVLKSSLVHIDTEGGLVHLARAVGTSSVVAFGPTSQPFFGYGSNCNLAPISCGDCWWTAVDWASKCPRGLASPSCMTEHSPEDIAARALLKRSPPVLLQSTDEGSLHSQRKRPVDSDDFNSARRSALVADRAWIARNLQSSAERLDTVTERFEVSEIEARVRRRPHDGFIPCSPTTLPAERSYFDSIDIRCDETSLVGLSRLICEAALKLRTGGTISVFSKFMHDLVDRAICATVDQTAGTRLRFENSASSRDVMAPAIYTVARVAGTRSARPLSFRRKSAPHAPK